VKDVIDAIDGPKGLFECKEIRERCAVFNQQAPKWATEGTCGIHKVMLEAEQAMRSVFAQYTLAALAATSASKAPDDFNRQILQWFDARPSNQRFLAE